MQQALDLVRRELGPEAVVLHTRERHGSLLGRVFVGRSYEIAATPGRDNPPLAKEATVDTYGRQPVAIAQTQERLVPVPSHWRGGLGMGKEFGAGVSLELNRTPNPQSAIHDPQSFQSLIEKLRTRQIQTPAHDIPAALFDLYTDLIEADIDESTARELLDNLRRDLSLDLNDQRAAHSHLARTLQHELRVAGPIRLTPGSARVVALVGPTGVGKTTTIAKLAANYRLRDNRRVGLITVDTYRIAAVEQLRTYAEIIDLPMEVVSTPREMRAAVQKMRDFDLVLMDTAGRSPRDEVRIRELRAMLVEAEPHEVHLVLSAAASARSLVAAAEKFAAVGVTSLLITKLDEATALGNLLTLARQCGLPFSYLTDGQNVPDDIAVAEAKPLAQMILNQEA
jgi:flagellar biosynthesis protein FlhF